MAINKEHQLFQRSARTSFFREKRAHLVGYGFITPLLLVWLLFSGYPYIRGVLLTFQEYYSFRPETWPLGSSFVGLRNYATLITDKSVWNGVRASFYLFISTVPATFVLSLATAVMLNRIVKGYLASTYRVVLTLSWVTPSVVAMLMWRPVFDANIGYVNIILRSVFHMTNPPAWLASPLWYWVAIGVASVWKSTGYAMLLFLIGLYNIPSELYDAARIDGANGWMQLLHIELPGIRNIMALYVITNIAWVGGGVVEVMTFGQGPRDIGRTLGLYAWETAFTGGGKLGYGSALSFFAGILNLVFVGLAFKLFPSEKS